MRELLSTSLRALSWLVACPILAFPSRRVEEGGRRCETDVLFLHPSGFAGASRANESVIEDGALGENVCRRLIRKVVRGGAAENEPPATPEAAAREAARRGRCFIFSVAER